MHRYKLPFIITKMLESLQLKNFILVKEMSVDFESGFNVITGETGAGKSLIIKSLGLLSGQSASDTIIYPKAEFAFVEATFAVSPHINIPSEYLDNGRLVVSRKIFKGRPSVNKINFESVTVKALKSVISKVVFTTAQHQMIELMDQTNHISIFDSYLGAEIDELTTDYKTAYDNYRLLSEQQQKLVHEQSHLKQEIRDLQELVNDVELQLFQKGEEETLYIQQKKCEALQERKTIVDSIRADSDSAASLLVNLDNMLIKLSNITDVPPKFDSSNIIEELNQLHQIMSQESMEIEYLEAIDINEINSRVNQIFKAKVKYNVNTLDELLDKAAKAKKQIKDLTTLIESSDTITSRVNAAYSEAIHLAKAISKKRRDFKSTFNFYVVNQLRQLGMVDAKFEASFSDVDGLAPQGVDSIEFKFSANPNMPLNSLKKVASGGELSRVMLGLIVGHSSVVDQPLLILDEVDVGVGGITANYMGNVMSTLAKKHQLIVVTHLPQIARCASNHFKITKTVMNNESCVTIKKLGKDDVSAELQRMIGGDVITSLIK